MGDSENPTAHNIVVYRVKPDTSPEFPGYDLYMWSLIDPDFHVKLNGPEKQVGQYEVTANGQIVIYRTHASDLYMVELANPGISTQLNVSGEQVYKFEVTADGQRVVYLADQGMSGSAELYIVELTHPGVSSKLNGPMVSGGGIFRGLGPRSFELCADGRRVVYAANQEQIDTYNLYAVELDNPGFSIKLNGQQKAGPAWGENRWWGSGDGAKICANGQRVVYIDSSLELYTVEFVNPGVPTKLSGPEQGIVSYWELSADAQKAIYLANSAFYMVELANPGVSKKLNGLVNLDPPADDGFYSDSWRLEGFEISPDRGQVIYGYALESFYGAVKEHHLYFSESANPGVSIRLDGPPSMGQWKLSADGQRVIYSANDVSSPEPETGLYMVELVKPGVFKKLNGSLDGTVWDWQLSPDGKRVIYRAGRPVADLYMVELADPGVSMKLNDVLASDTGVSRFTVSDDNRHLVYTTRNITNELSWQMFVVDLSKPGYAINLSTPAVQGRLVDFEVIGTYP